MLTFANIEFFYDKINILSANALKILLYICAKSGAKSHIPISLNDFIKSTKISRTAVFNTLKELEASGYIVTHKRNRSTTYFRASPAIADFFADGGDADGGDRRKDTDQINLFTRNAYFEEFISDQSEGEDVKHRRKYAAKLRAQLDKGDPFTVQMFNQWLTDKELREKRFNEFRLNMLGKTLKMPIKGSSEYHEVKIKEIEKKKDDAFFLTFACPTLQQEFKYELGSPQELATFCHKYKSENKQ
ncbi:MAG: replication protein [Helicobacteraceae bacterium]|jgi:DNA-binding PadR family transcriptional regulator|nr:replication protein [Helicobacteraceae bacterium]